MGDPFWRAVGNADGVSLAILDPVSSLVGGGATNDGGLARFTMGGARCRAGVGVMVVAHDTKAARCGAGQSRTGAG